MATQIQLQSFLAGNRMASCEAETTKKSIKTKLEAEIVSLSMFSKLLKLRIIVMSTNLEYSER